MNAQTVIRCPKDGTTPYFSISRDLAQDKSLSFAARGMMLYLLSQPSDWIVQVKDLQQNCGRDKTYRILKELREHGYVCPGEKRQKEDGTFEWDAYQIVEKPGSEQPCPENPDTVSGEPCPDLPYTENQDVLHIKESTEEHTTGAVAPVEAAGETPERVEPSVESKPTSERIMVRDEVIEGCEFAKTEKTQKATYGRSGKITRYLMGQPVKEGAMTYALLRPEWAAKPGDFSRFVGWWKKKCPNVPVPRSLDKLQSRWSEWRECDQARSESDSPALHKQTASLAAEQVMYAQESAS